jgi:hypothetical protein
LTAEVVLFQAQHNLTAHVALFQLRLPEVVGAGRKLWETVRAEASCSLHAGTSCPRRSEAGVVDTEGVAMTNALRGWLRRHRDELVLIAIAAVASALAALGVNSLL